jgi:WD40 repeat protein
LRQKRPLAKLPPRVHPLPQIRIRGHVQVRLQSERDQSSTIMKVVFSPSGDLLAASDSDGGVAVWDLRYLDGEPLIFSNKRVWPPGP